MLRKHQAVVGIGVDVAAIGRFTTALERNPDLAPRLFTAGELRRPSGARRDPASLAARFAAKEAVAKALGAPGGMRWHDVEVVIGPAGAPGLRLSGTVAAVATSRGVAEWHLSLSHDAGIACAFVTATR